MISQPIEPTLDFQRYRRYSNPSKFIIFVKTWRTIAEKSIKAKGSMAEKLGRIDAENCTLKEAMAKIEMGNPG